MDNTSELKKTSFELDQETSSAGSADAPPCQSASPEAQTSSKQADDTSINSYCQIHVKSEIDNSSEIEAEWEHYKGNFYDSLFPLSTPEYGESSSSSRSESMQKDTLHSTFENMVKSEPVSPDHSCNGSSDSFSNHNHKLDTRTTGGRCSAENVSQRFFKPNCEQTMNEGLVKQEILSSNKIVSVNLQRITLFDINYVCKVCSSVFSREELLRRHLTTHETVVVKDITVKGKETNSNIREMVSFYCDICGAEFSTSFFLKRHKMSHSDGRPFKCGQCSLRFKHLNNLTQHKMIHNGEKPYVCPTCPFRCRKLSGLKRHADNHEGETPYKCDVCSLSFKKEIVLKRHMALHNTERKYECDICSLVFRKVNHLTSHKTIHTDVKLYKCEICSSQFRRSSDLKRHTQFTHSERRAFSCDICNMKFKHSCNLKKHKAKHCNGTKSYHKYLKV